MIVKASALKFLFLFLSITILACTGDNDCKELRENLKNDINEAWNKYRACENDEDCMYSTKAKGIERIKCLNICGPGQAINKRFESDFIDDLNELNSTQCVDRSDCYTENGYQVENHR